MRGYMILKYEDGQVSVKVAQIFYRQGVQIFIADEEKIVSEIAHQYAAARNGEKIRVFSPYGNKLYVFSVEDIVAIIVTNPDDISVTGKTGEDEDEETEEQ